MSNLPETTVSSQLMEKVIIGGDLSQLTPQQRVAYYKAACESMGLNPFTKPFGYIMLNGKLTLYALKGATDQLRKIHEVSIYKTEKERIDDLFLVTAYARDKTNRTDTDMGVVTVGHLQGDKLANAMMKAMTKAKRRVTLSLCGLGWLDETEIETIPTARHIEVSEEGEIIDTDPEIEDAPGPGLSDNGQEAEPKEGRTWLQWVCKNGRTELRNVWNAMVMSGEYANWQHAKNAMSPNEKTGNEGYPFPEDFEIKADQPITCTGALKVYDWAMERKEDTVAALIDGTVVEEGE